MNKDVSFPLTRSVILPERLRNQLAPAKLAKNTPALIERLVDKVWDVLVLMDREV